MAPATPALPVIWTLLGANAISTAITRTAAITPLCSLSPTAAAAPPRSPELPAAEQGPQRDTEAAPNGPEWPSLARTGSGKSQARTDPQSPSPTSDIHRRHGRAAHFRLPPSQGRRQGPETGYRAPPARAAGNVSGAAPGGWGKGRGQPGRRRRGGAGLMTLFASQPQGDRVLTHEKRERQC